jgi:hypothetical protein
MSGNPPNSTPTPVDITFNNSEIKSSDSLTSSENKDTKGKLGNFLSALSGSSPGGSTVERTRSETDPKYSYKYPSSGDESSIPFFQPFQDATPAKVLPLKQVTRTGAKMASPDQDLEFVIIDIMGFTLTHPNGLVLPQSYVVTFEEFCSIDVNDVYEFTYTDKTTSSGSPNTKLHFMLVKQVQRCIHYTQYKEAQNNVQSNSPTLWLKSEYITWCQNVYA